jgi:hypothetical protein
VKLPSGLKWRYGFPPVAPHDEVYPAGRNVRRKREGSLVNVTWFPTVSVSVMAALPCATAATAVILRGFTTKSSEFKVTPGAGAWGLFAAVLAQMFSAGL